MEQYFEELDHQNWNTIVIHNTSKKDSQNNKKTNLSDSQLKEKKINKQVENDELKHKKVTIDIRKNIQQKRCDVNLTQKQLAQKANLPISVISDIESGKGIYNSQHINKLKRILKL